MGVDKGNLQVIDVDVILENCLITIVILNLLVYSKIQYSTKVILVYESKCHRTIIPHYIMSCSVVHKNVMILWDWQQRHVFVLQHAHRELYTLLSTCVQYVFISHSYVLYL